MDGVIVCLAAVILYFVFRPNSVQEMADIPMEVIIPNPYLNPEMRHDEHAFMKIANELGFH